MFKGSHFFVYCFIFCKYLFFTFLFSLLISTWHFSQSGKNLVFGFLLLLFFPWIFSELKKRINKDTLDRKFCDLFSWKLPQNRKAEPLEKTGTGLFFFLSKTVHVVQPAAQCDREMSAAVRAGVGVRWKCRTNTPELKTIPGRCCKRFTELKQVKFY